MGDPGKLRSSVLRVHSRREVALLPVSGRYLMCGPTRHLAANATLIVKIAMSEVDWGSSNSGTFGKRSRNLHLVDLSSSELSLVDRSDVDPGH